MKRILLHCAVLVFILGTGRMSLAQDAAGPVKQVMDKQVSAWNQGDIAGFMRGYEDSPETTFVGKTVRHGWQEMLERYKQTYPSKEAMGTLEFLDFHLRMLGPDYAAVTGRYHLTRTAAGGGDASGLFSLVWKKTAGGWKIILDHTS